MSAGGRGPELLDIGPLSSSSARRRWAVLLLVLAVLMAGGLVTRLTRSSDLADRRPTPSPAPRTPTPAPRTPATQPPTAPVVLRPTGPTVPGFEVGDLFVRSRTTVFRIRLGDGRVTATPAAGGGSSPVGFVAGREGVLLLPPDGPGLLVPDDRPARRVAGLLQPGSQVLPGPDGQVWVSALLDGQSSSLVLSDLEGVRTGRTVRETGYFLADGRGGLLLSDVGGVYVSQDARWRRLTTGSVVATGPHHLVVLTCDADHDCGNFRYDRRTGTMTRLAMDDRSQLGQGLVSPDGRRVAWTTYGSTGATALEVIDLASGRRLAQTVAAENAYDTETAAVWSSDGRYLLTLDEGRLVVIESATGRITRPDLDLPDLLALSLRPAP